MDEIEYDYTKELLPEDAQALFNKRTSEIAAEVSSILLF